VKDDNTLYIEHGKPMIRKNRDKGIRMRNMEPEVAAWQRTREDDLPSTREDGRAGLAFMLSRMRHPEFPKSWASSRCPAPIFEQGVHAQIQSAIEKQARAVLRSCSTPATRTVD
jgi:hypothetical protein